MGGEPIAEHAVADRLRAVGAEHVEVGARLGVAQGPVLVPARLTDSEHVAEPFEQREVDVLGAGIGDGDPRWDQSRGGG
jgi:hypothetical protein